MNEITRADNEITRVEGTLEPSDKEIIASLRAKVAELEALVTIDALTGIVNRRGLLKRLEELLDIKDRYAGSVFIAFLDLDEFKPINDTLGHQGGDEVLKIVSQRLQGVIRPNDVVGRLGGDEFVVMGRMEPGAGAIDLEGVAHRILQTICQPIKVGDVEVTVGVSIGIIEYLERLPTSPVELITAADRLMYRVKNAGKNAFQVEVLS